MQNIKKLNKGICNYCAKALLISIVTFVYSSCTSSNAPQTAKPKQDTTIRTDSSHLVGMWLDEEIKTDNGDQVAYQIVTQGPKTYIQVITFNEKKLSINDNPDISPSALEVRKEKNKYISVADNKNVYLIENSGDLLIYDATGFIAKCKKML